MIRPMKVLECAIKEVVHPQNIPYLPPASLCKISFFTSLTYKNKDPTPNEGPVETLIRSVAFAHWVGHYVLDWLQYLGKEPTEAVILESLIQQWGWNHGNSI